MTRTEITYTYRGGQRVPLIKLADQFVARALPDRLISEGIGDEADMYQVSSASTRVVVPPAELEGLMKRSRAIAPTHHAYVLEANDQNVLITDRVLVSFKQALAPDVLGTFAGKYGWKLEFAL